MPHSFKVHQFKENLFTMKLIKNHVYNGWRYTSSYRSKCDKCGRIRQKCHEFIREDTPYGDNWNGYKYPEEPIMLGSECVKELLGD